MSQDTIENLAPPIRHRGETFREGDNLVFEWIDVLGVAPNEYAGNCPVPAFGPKGENLPEQPFDFPIPDCASVDEAFEKFIVACEVHLAAENKRAADFLEQLRQQAADEKRRKATEKKLYDATGRVLAPIRK